VLQTAFVPVFGSLLIGKRAFADFEKMVFGYAITLLQANETITKNKKHENWNWNFDDVFAAGWIYFDYLCNKSNRS
jgi:hypothetical protein